MKYFFLKSSNLLGWSFSCFSTSLEAFLKKSLKRRNVRFLSQTDSEVVSALIDSLYDGDFFKAVKDTVNLLEGSFALAIVCSDFPDTLIAVKKDSPLIK